MDWKELMLWAFVFVSVVAAIAVPVGIHLSNNNKKSVPTNTPEPGGTGPPVPPIVPPQSGQTPPVPPQSGQPPPVPPIVPPPPVTPIVPPPPVTPQSGQAALVPPIVPPSVPKKYTYEQQAPDYDQFWGCQLPNGRFSSVSATESGGMGRGLLETECSERAECVGYYDGGPWLVSTNKKPSECDTKSSQKYPYFYLKTQG
jgi:hypothetical protein